MAKASSAANSNAPCPRNSVRASSHAMPMPSVAVSGAEMAASLSVVKNEFHAVPAHTTPNSPHSTLNAVRKCASVMV
ncbi:hypothetical protein D3C71_1221280 [compost metagenome]